MCFESSAFFCIRRSRSLRTPEEAGCIRRKIYLLPAGTGAAHPAYLRHPQNVFFRADKSNGLTKDSLLLTNFKWPLNKYQLLEYLGSFDEADMIRVAQAAVCQNPFVRLAFSEDFLNSPLLQRIITYEG